MEPIALSSSIHKKIKLFKESSDLSEEHLKTVKREMYGDFLRSFDSVEQLANQFVNYLSDEEHYFDIPKLILEKNILLKLILQTLRSSQNNRKLTSNLI